jgi:ribosomal protein S18 acetylase RimI-like enzyme
MLNQQRFSLRAATRQDSAAIIAVTNAAYIVEQTIVKGQRTDRQHIEECFEQGGFFVIDDRDQNEKIVASVFWQIVNGRGYFGLLAVDPTMQGFKLARRLINAVTEHCVKAGCAFLDISVLSVRAELFGFYRKLGFASFDTRPFDAPDTQIVPFKIIRMTKALRDDALL